MLAWLCSSQSYGSSLTETESASHKPVGSGYLYLFETVLNKVKQQRVEENHYCHENKIDLIKRSDFYGNCYGLGAYLIGSTEPWALAEIITYMKINTKLQPTFDSQGLPAPLHYVAFIEALENKIFISDYWIPLRRPKDLRKGYLIAYTTYKEHARACWGQHLMFVAEKPYIQENQVEVKVLDATAYPHGQEDSRDKAGLGVGTIRLYLNEKEEACKIQWSLETKPLLRCIKMMALKI